MDMLHYTTEQAPACRHTATSTILEATRHEFHGWLSDLIVQKASVHSFQFFRHHYKSLDSFLNVSQ